MTTELNEPATVLRQRLDEANRRSESLRQVIESISGELALGPLLTRIVESAVQLIGARQGTIGLVAERADGPIVRTAAAYNMPPYELGAEMPPGVGIAGAVLVARRPVRLDRYGDLEWLALPEFADHSVLGVPIWWGERMIGFFGVGAPPPRRFDDADIETLALFARHAAIAIENAQRYEGERRRTEQLTLIARLGRIIAANLQLGELLQSAADSIHELLGYPNVAIALIAPEDARILVLRTFGGDYRAIMAGEYRLSIDEGIMGAAARERRVELVNDVLADPRYFPTPGAIDPYAELALPILHGEQVLGVLNVESSQTLTQQDAASLQVVADQLASAIVNARLFAAERQRVARLAAIERIGRLITSRRNLDELLQTAVEAIHMYLAQTNIALLLIDSEDAETLVLSGRSGIYESIPIGGYRQSIHVGIIGAAARSRQRVLVSDVRSDARYLPVPGAEWVRSELAVPVVAGERLLGVLNVESGQTFGETDAEGIEILADQLAAAIQNARLFEAERRRAARIEVINRIGRLLASSLSPEAVFQIAVEAIQQQLNFTYVASGMVDPEDPQMLVLLAQAGDETLKVEPGYRQSIYEGIVGTAARTRKRILVRSVANDRRYLAVLRSASIRAELAVPVVAGDRLLGILNIESERPIDDDDATGVEIIADQLSIAIENARLFAETQTALDRTRLLYETSRQISSALLVEDVIATYLQHVAARGRYACGVTLYEFDATGQRAARLIWGRWTPREGLVETIERLPYTTGGYAAQLDGGQTVTIVDAQGDERVSPEFREFLARSHWRALALIPLIVRDQRLGMVWLSHPSAYEWNDADLYPYQVTAALLASAIDSRRQHLLLAERGQQLAVLEERRRLARELHDSVTQSLFSMSLLAQVLPDLWEIDREEARAGLLQIRDLTRGALAEMRALLFELRPVELGARGLAPALREYAGAFSQRTAIGVTVADIGELDLPEPVEQAFFRIAQEALANIARHAGAHQVRVSLQRGRPARLTIVDDGRGFQVATPSAGTFGLTSMRERAGKIGARLRVDSILGKGTEIYVEWPDPDRET
jgi:GAF domain-containing protein